METERKEIQKPCEICEGTNLVHVTAGWKDYSFWCPKCKPGKFRQGVANTSLTIQAALDLIKNSGRPGES